MNKKLQLPYAEIYTIEYTPSIKKKNLDLYIKEQLDILHPGFSSDSLWDYKKLRNSNKTIKAVVLDKSYFIECRLKESIRYFFIEENNITYKFFSKNKFTNTGKRKNNNLLYIILFFLTAIVISSILLICIPNKNKPESLIVTQEPVPEISHAINIFNLMNYCARKTVEKEGFINGINFVYEQQGKLSLLVNGIEPYDLINQLIDNKYIENCYCTNISYIGSIENYEIQIDLKATELLVEQKNNLELLELQKQLIAFLRSNNVVVLNSSINQDFCKVDTKFIVDRNELENLHVCLQKYLIDNLLFITSFNEIVDNNNKCVIALELLQLSQNQQIEKTSEEESISKVLPIIKTKNIEPIKKQNNEEKKGSPVQMQKLTKIGSVNKDGKRFFYYRTEEGKLYTSEEEL